MLIGGSLRRRPAAPGLEAQRGADAGRAALGVALTATREALHKLGQWLDETST